MTKNILYILTKSDLGGVSKYLLEIVKNLPKDIKPYFIMSSTGYFSEELEKIGYKDNIYYVPMTNSITNILLHIKSNLQTLGIIKKIKPDLIHCNSTTGGIIGRICGFLTKTPVIFTAHGWAYTDGISKSKQRFYKCLESILGLLTKKIICVSEYDKQIASEVMPFFKKKLITIHNGISDIDEIYKKKDFSTQELKIVMISRFCPQKDPYTLINAVNELNKEGLNIKLDLYGYGEELQQVLNLIQSCACSNIQYKGEISDVTPILKDYDIYSLITNWEGLPIGIIEALRANLPVIVSNVGGCSELVIDGKNGFLVNRKDKIQLKEKIKFLYTNKEILPILGVNSRILYEVNYRVNLMTQTNISIYKEMLNE